MIKVKITRSASSGNIMSYRAEGHAAYEVPGKDIVCAGVSAVTIGTYNSIEALLGVHLKYRMYHGFFEMSVSEQLESKTFEKLQLLLESMVVTLQSIQQSYGEYLSIEETIKSR